MGMSLGIYSIGYPTSRPMNGTPHKLSMFPWDIAMSDGEPRIRRLWDDPRDNQWDEFPQGVGVMVWFVFTPYVCRMPMGPGRIEPCLGYQTPLERPMGRAP